MPAAPHTLHDALSFINEDSSTPQVWLDRIDVLSDARYNIPFGYHVKKFCLLILTDALGRTISRFLMEKGLTDTTTSQLFVYKHQILNGNNETIYAGKEQWMEQLKAGMVDPRLDELYVSLRCRNLDETNDTVYPTEELETLFRTRRMYLLSRDRILAPL
jgi:hypothetical protein